MIHELLSVGENNARTCNELAKVLNMEPRDVRQAIRLERLNGALICGNGKGYYLPENENDVTRSIMRLVNTGKATLQVANAMKKNAKKGVNNE